MSGRRVPDRGDDGLLRFECPHCRRLLWRFLPGLKGTVEVVCPRSSCRELVTVTFNATEIPELA